MKKHLFLNLLALVLLIFIVAVSSVSKYGEQAGNIFFTVQSNNHEYNINAFKVSYKEDKTEDWLIKAIDKCKENAPAYFTPYWNWLWWIKDSTNCYAYAFDMTKNPTTGEYFERKVGLQPGAISNQRVGGNIYNASTRSNKRLVEVVTKDMMELGYVFVEAGPEVDIPEKAYMVALSVFSGDQEYMSDYHWYRLNPDGTWSHKPGFDGVTNLDEAGDIIVDPQKADRGHYTCFVGYFYVVKNIKYD